MIPSLCCDPKINVLIIGAEILKLLVNKRIAVENILAEISEKLEVSIDHVILSLDWLYLIYAISLEENEVYINEVN